MSQRFGIGKNPQVKQRAEQLSRAQQRVSRGARQATRQVGPRSREARRIASERLTSARGWSAPRVDRAGSFIEREAGPRVGALLHRTAGRLEPPAPRRRRGLAAVLLLVGGALGAAGAIATRRGASRAFTEPSPTTTTDRLSAVSKNSSTEGARMS